MNQITIPDVHEAAARLLAPFGVGGLPPLFEDLDPEVLAKLQELGPQAAVGNIDPRYLAVGDASITPRYMGAVGIPAAAMAVAPQGAPVDYSPTEYVAAEVSYMGMGVTVIPAALVAGTPGTRVTVLQKPDRPIHPQQYKFPSNVQNLLLHQVVIGGSNMMANEAGIPIETLSEVSRMPQINMQTINPSTGIQMIVSNRALFDQEFSANIYGTMLRR